MRRGATVVGLADTAGTGMLPSRKYNEFRNTTDRPMETSGVYMIERRVI